MIQEITLKRHGQNNWLETTLDNGVYIAIKDYQAKEVMIEVYKQDEINIRKIYKTKNNAIKALERLNDIKIIDEIEAYIVNKSSKNVNDIYHAAAVFCEYSQTFRTTKENYCIASIADNGELDFSCRDKCIEHIHIENIPQLNTHAKWTFHRTDTDNVWTAWLLSEYMKKSGRFQTVKTTVKNFNKCSVWGL